MIGFLFVSSCEDEAPVLYGPEPDLLEDSTQIDSCNNDTGSGNE